MTALDADAAIVVHACKYDGRIHRRWAARLRERRENLIILDAEFDAEIRHPLLGTIEVGTKSVEYYWTNRWYNIFRFSTPDGHLRNYYCNINTPAEMIENLLVFTDLDIDVLVAPDFSYSVLDEDEFARHTIEYRYPEDVQRQARASLAELLALIESQRFPFSEEA